MNALHELVLVGHALPWATALAQLGFTASPKRGVHKMRQADIRTCIELRKAGKMHHEIAALVGSTTTAVTKMLNKYGVKAPPTRKVPSNYRRHTPLTVEEVREMRRQFAEEGVSRKELARRFNVGHSTASDIVARRTWGDV